MLVIFCVVSNKRRILCDEEDEFNQTSLPPSSNRVHLYASMTRLSHEFQ